MRARIGFVVFMLVFVITIAATLIGKAVMRSYPLVSQPLLTLARLPKVLFRTQDWLKIRTSLSGWKNFLQRAS